MGFNRSYLRHQWSDPTWLPGSYVILNTDSSDKDDTVATEYVQDSMRRQITWGEVEDWQRANPTGDLNAWLEQRLSKKATIASKHAYLAAKIVEWGGLDNIVDEDYQDDTQDPIGTDEETGQPIYPIHADAGKVAPITPFWVSMHGPAVVDRMWNVLREQQKGRSAEEQDRFRRRRESLDEHRRDEAGPQEEPATA